jgi:CHAT domain-containing protein
MPSVLVPGSKLLIAGVQHAYDQRLPSLVNVGPEMDLIRHITSSTGVAVDSIAAAERGSMRASLQSSQWAHIACHGIQHPRAPLQSAFCLADGNLTVSDLMELKLDHAFFAFLSACETAREDEVQAGQVIHLAAAMLFVGFRSVVATMWCVDWRLRRVLS